MSRPLDDEGEQRHFSNVISTFLQYKRYALSANNRRRKDLYALPQPDQKLLVELGYGAKLNAVDDAIIANARFLEEVIADPEIFGEDPPQGEQDEGVENNAAAFTDSGSLASEAGAPSQTHLHPSSPSSMHSHSHEHGNGHDHTHSHSHSDPPRGRYKATDFDMDKLRSTIKQFVRDWSAEGSTEREACYQPMKDALVTHFADIPPEERHNFRVLVPGAGLGRLAWDVAKLGFSSQGNEFSHYMLLGSFFVLNRTTELERHTLYPYVHSFSNLPDRESLLRPIRIPDALPSTLPPDVQFSYVAGDFEAVYGTANADDEPQAGQWDAVLTCFFLDTAKNVVNYMKIIHNILAPGGVWINLGPLLWHWENNSTSDLSIELDLAEVKSLARSVGFEIKEQRTITTTYTNNARSMLGHVYNAAFWTATKVV